MRVFRQEGSVQIGAENIINNSPLAFIRAIVAKTDYYLT